MIWHCPIVATIDDKEAVKRLISTYDHENTIAMDARAWKLDNILRKRRSIMFENRMEGN